MEQKRELIKARKNDGEKLDQDSVNAPEVAFIPIKMPEIKRQHVI